MTSEHDRRRVLARATVGVGALTGTVIAAPAAANLVAPGFRTNTFEYVDLGPAGSFPENPGGAFQIVTFESRDPDPTGRDDGRRARPPGPGRLDAVDLHLRRHPLAPPGTPVSGLLAPLYPDAPL